MARDDSPSSSRPDRQGEDHLNGFSNGYSDGDYPPPPPLDFDDTHTASGAMSTDACTPSSYSIYSISSTLEHRVFREDDGRLYQAANDEYATQMSKQWVVDAGSQRGRLPSTLGPGLEQASTPLTRNLQRLDNQHFGIKVMQGGRNYLGPVEAALPNGGEGRRALDIGTGTGIWLTEMANEFPNAEWIGVDLVPIQRDYGLPENVQFVQDDVTKGLSFPDGSFDLVHARFLLLGIRKEDWPAVIAEAARLVKPGGLLVWVDITIPWPCVGLSDEAARERAPGYMTLLDKVSIAATARGLDVDAGRNVAQHMGACKELRDVQQTHLAVPLWAWSDEPIPHKAGTIMTTDARELVQSGRLLVVDGCGMTHAEFDVLGRGYLADVGKKEASAALPTWHSWAWKVGGASPL